VHSHSDFCFAVLKALGSSDPEASGELIPPSPPTPSVALREGGHINFRQML